MNEYFVNPSGNKNFERIKSTLENKELCLTDFFGLLAWKFEKTAERKQIRYIHTDHGLFEISITRFKDY